MGRKCKRCAKYHACELRRRALELQLQKEAFSLGNDAESFEDDSLCTTSISEESDTTSTSEPDIPTIKLDASVFREPFFKGQIFKYFLAEEEGAIAKWHRCRHVSKFNELEMALTISSKATEIVDAFNNCVNTCEWTLEVEPSRMGRTPPVHGHPEGRYAILERYFPNPIKANSNTGWVPQIKAIPGKLCQALSHFSYAYTNYQAVLCDFYVSHSSKEKHIVIMSASIMTREGGVYGYADLGLKGVRNFFRWHVCNSFCCMYRKPCHLEAHFRPNKRTLLLK